jgi:DNA-binding XRE family transcriptional regulator
VSDFLYIDGWSVDYLGADMPGEELAAFTGRTNPDLVAISAVLGADLNPLQEAIRQIRVAAPGAKVLVGGAAIADDEHAKSLGADGFAQDAAGAVLVARRLVGLKTGETLGELLGRIGENLRSLRRSRNWNQQQMATAAGVDRTYLSGVENGKQNLSLAALQKLAGALDFPAAELLK